MHKKRIERTMITKNDNEKKQNEGDIKEIMHKKESKEL